MTRKSLLLLTAAIACVTTVGAIAIEPFASPRTQKGTDRPVVQGNREGINRQRAAKRTGGLIAAAAVSGTFYEQLSPTGAPGPDSLAHLSEMSTVVVRGRAGANQSKLVSDGHEIATVSNVEVLEIMKGSPSERINVRLPGGEYTFPDGTSAKQVVVGFGRLVEGRDYILYLRRATDGDYEPTAGPLAIYGLSLRAVKFVNAAGLIRTTHLGMEIAKLRLTPPEFIRFVKANLR